MKTILTISYLVYALIVVITGGVRISTHEQSKPSGDTLEATIFLNNVRTLAIGDHSIDSIKCAFPVVGYAVMSKEYVQMYDGNGQRPFTYRIICYLDHRRRLINTANVWDYKLREK